MRHLLIVALLVACHPTPPVAPPPHRAALARPHRTARTAPSRLDPAAVQREFAEPDEPGVDPSMGSCGPMRTESPRCSGAERWRVKTGNDDDAANIGLDEPVVTTIARLRALTRPGDAPPSESLTCRRVGRVERTYYELNDVLLTNFRREADCDVHLVLDDGAGNTVVAELATAGMVAPGSPWREMIADARRKFDAQFGNRRRADNLECTVSLRGVGFFDRVHGALGSAENGIELHPVLEIEFGEGCQ